MKLIPIEITEKNIKKLRFRTIQTKAFFIIRLPFYFPQQIERTKLHILHIFFQ